ERRPRDLPADLAEISRNHVESSGETLLPGTAAKFRRGAHFRPVRSVGTSRCSSLQPAQHSLRGRTHRHVYTDREEFLAQAFVSCVLRQRLACCRAFRGGNVGARSRRTHFRRSAEGKNFPATQRRRGTPAPARARNISRWNISRWNISRCP